MIDFGIKQARLVAPLVLVLALAACSQPIPSPEPVPTPPPPTETPTEPTPPGEPAPPPEESAPEYVDPNGNTFTFVPVGQLLPETGDGLVEEANLRPGIRFPIQKAPAYLNSQVHRWGGSIEGPNNPDLNPSLPGVQNDPLCTAKNYAYPWQDTFCENRADARPNPLCPIDGDGHQGEDIRGAQCFGAPGATPPGVNVVVATEDGTITMVETHYITIRSTDETTYYNYLHMSPREGFVLGQSVTRGQVLGTIGDLDRNGNHYNTTYHLHLDMKQVVPTVNGGRATYVNSYMALVDAYQRLLAGDEPL